MKSFLINSAIKVASKFVKTNKLTVLTYHQVGDINSAHNKLLLDVELFEQHLIWLKKYFNVLGLKEAFQLMLAGRLPERAVVISIDDGYVDSFTTIFPLLKKHDLLASFFIATAGIEEGYLWDELVSASIMQAPTSSTSLMFSKQLFSLRTYNEKLSAISEITKIIKYASLEERNTLMEELLLQTGVNKIKHQFLKREHILKLHEAGMCIGAHTVNHPILACEPAEIAEKEMLDSKITLENIIGDEVNFLAYPNGKPNKDFTELHQQQAKNCEFLAAFSTDWGCSSIHELFALKRITLSDRIEFRFCIRLMLSYMS